MRPNLPALLPCVLLPACSLLGCGPDVDGQAPGDMRRSAQEAGDEGEGEGEGEGEAAAEALRYSVTITDPSGALADSHADLQRCAEGALSHWSRYLSGAAPLNIEVAVENTAVGRFAGASTSNVVVGDCANHPAPCLLVREQALHRLITGASPQNGTFDARITVTPSYWQNEVWADPDPIARTAPVPDNRLDCVSLFIHEMTHAFGMNGFRTLSSGAITGGYLSLYDDLLTIEDNNWRFVGPQTQASLGAIPVTRTNLTQNLYHYADATTPSAFDQGLMNGLYYAYGHRYNIELVDVLILKDLGAPVRALP